MPDREHEDLERELRELASRTKYPPTPDVSQKVRRELDAEPAQRRRVPRAFDRPRWVAAAAATILLSLTVLSPAIRSTVFISSGASGGAGQAGGVGSGASDAASAEYAAQPPPEPDGAAASGGASEDAPDEASAGAAAGASAATSVAPRPGSSLGLGGRISSSEARSRTGELLLPEAPNLAGEPAVFYARGPSEADGVVVVFGPGPGLPPLGDTDVGLLLVEVPGDLASAYPLVEGASGTPTEEVDVDGRRGYWLPDGRLLRSQPGDGLPGGALLWEQEDTAMLLRANVTREEAIRIAGTIR